MVIIRIANDQIPFNPSNAEATFIQSKRTLSVLKNNLNPVMPLLIG